MKNKITAASVLTFLLSTNAIATPGFDPFANAIVINYGGTDYQLALKSTTFNADGALLNATPWRNDSTFAQQILAAYVTSQQIQSYAIIPDPQAFSFEALSFDGTDNRIYRRNILNQSYDTLLNFGPVDNRNNQFNYLTISNLQVWVLPPLGPSTSDTNLSLLQNAFALRNAFNLQFAKIAQGLSYDCTVYDQKNICVSFAGSKSDGKGFDATTGVLILAHKPTNHFRFGGYIDQSFGSSTSGGLTTKKGNPGFGAFAVWSQNADGSGVQLRAAANLGKVDIETKREAIGTAEAGEGQSNIKSQGFSLEVSKDYAINSMWSARPYVGYRQTTNIRAGYAERSSNDVTAPLTYGSLKQTAETFTAGATFAHTLSAKTTMYLTAGIEHDLKNRIGDYSSTSSSIGDIDNINISSDKTKTRPTVSFALSHNIDKTQRVGLSLTHRKAAFASGSTTSAVLQYSKGF